MKSLNEYLKTDTKPNLERVIDEVFDKAVEAVDTYFADKKIFTKDKYKFFEYDEHIFKTNAVENFTNTMYVIIDNDENIKQQFNRDENKLSIKAPDLFLKLDDIKKGILKELVNKFDSNSTFYLDKYSIVIKHVLSISPDETCDYFFRIIPAITYINEDNVKGVMYYNSHLKEIKIDYPELSISNFVIKNALTYNALTNLSVMAKNILMEMDKVKELPSEIFETVFYNVPEEILLESKGTNMLPVLNYLRNKSLKTYYTIDLQDKAFDSKYKSMSFLYVKHILAQLEKFYKKTGRFN